MYCASIYMKVNMCIYIYILISNHISIYIRTLKTFKKYIHEKNIYIYKYIYIYIACHIYIYYHFYDGLVRTGLWWIR